MKILTIFCLKPLGFLWFYVKIITKTEVLEGFRLAREKKKNVHFTLFFCKGLLKIDDVRTRNVIFYCFLQGKTKDNKKPDPVVLHFSEASSRK